MDFGDYTFIIPSNEKLGICEDVFFHDYISIERKNSVDEVAINATKKRKQFQAEYERHKGIMILMIEQEDGYKDMCYGNYRSKVSPKSLLGTLHKWHIDYGVLFTFVNKEVAGIYIYQTFKYYLKHCFDKKSEE